MKRRIGGLGKTYYTGLGGGIPDILDNVWTSNKEFNTVIYDMFSDALNNINLLKEYEGFDFKIYYDKKSFRILFGLEPTYMYNPYIMYCIDSDKEEIYLQQGKAKGNYGTDIEINNDYKFSEGILPKDFSGLIDRWYGKLVEFIK